jgi:hypothetical protein
MVNEQGLCSCLWRIWMHKNECYMCPNNLGGTLKASFHSDGSCHVGLTSELRSTLYEPEWMGQSRHFDTWLRIENGVVERILELWIPTSHLGKMARIRYESVHWLKAAPEGFMISIGLFRVTSSEKLRQVCHNPRDDFLCSFEFIDGTHLLVLARELKEPFNLQSLISTHVRQSVSPQRATKQYGSPENINLSDESIRALFWTSDHSGKRLWIDSIMVKTLK